jgi:hypothetical protein
MMPSTVTAWQRHRARTTMRGLPGVQGAALRLLHGAQPWLHARAVHGVRHGSGRTLHARLGILAALCVLASPLSCSRSGPQPAAARGSDPIMALRYRIAEEPEDVDARVALARLELAARRPGAALEQLAFLDRADAVPESEQRALATLYAQRFEERLALGDGGAHVDAEAALRLDPALALPAERRAEGYFLAALAGLRRANRWGRQDAARFLARAAALAPADPRLVVRLAAAPAAGARTPAAAPSLEELGAAALWLHRSGARRAALDLLDSYVDRGGNDRAVLQAWVGERAWWSGDEGYPGLLQTRALQAAGVNLCLLAGTPDAPGCGDSLWAVAERDDTLASAVWERAAQRFWYTRDPGQAAAWSLLATRAWLAGEGASWSALLRARVDVAAMAGSPRVPDHAAAAIWRAAGNAGQAAAALDRVLAHVLGHASGDARPDDAAGVVGLSPGAQALIVAEAAAQRRPGEVIEALRARLPAAGAIGWQSAVWAAYGRGDGARLGALLAEQPEEAPRILAGIGALGPLAWRHGRRVHALAWWSRLAGRDQRLARGRSEVERGWSELLPAPAGWRMPPTTVTVPAAALVEHEDPAIAAALVAVAEAYAHEPAVADRLARDVVARAPSLGRHGPAVARLFAALGAHDRALAWWERIAAESPQHPPYLLALGVAAAASGEVLRASVHIEAAAARSGNAGATFLRAAAELWRQGHALEAVATGRKALLLAPSGQRGPVLALLARAMRALDRARDADAMRAAWLDDVPEPFRARARAAVQAQSPATLDGNARSDDGANGEQPGGAHQDDDAGTALAEAWGPQRLSALIAAVRTQDPVRDAAGQAADVTALAAQALLAPPAQAREAFEVLAGALARMGAGAEARAVQAARVAVDGLWPARAPALPPP